MKKLVLAIAIVLGMGIGAYAQGGLFKYGQEAEQTRGGGLMKDGPGIVIPGHAERLITRTLLPLAAALSCSSASAQLTP